MTTNTNNSTNTLSIDEILVVQGIAVQHNNTEMLYAAWAALGYCRRVAFVAVTDRQRTAAIETCREVLAIQKRLDLAVAESWIWMIHRCRRALRGEHGAMQEWRDAAEMAAAMGPIVKRPLAEVGRG
jgi:hypothetical protein